LEQSFTKMEANITFQIPIIILFSFLFAVRDCQKVKEKITSSQPFFFLVDLPEGNYNVKVVMGDLQGESITTIKAESRRLMIEKLQTSYGQIVTKMFTTNVRYSSINSGDEVRLKSREIGHPNWDHQLSIEFSNEHPCICGIEIEKAENVITVYLAGNSTVTDQKTEPWAAWGQMLPAFFKPGVISVANHAESGEALKSFMAEKRLDKIMSTIQPGDYLFIQFGHNDQKKESSAYLDPFTGYKDYLKHYIGEARDHGAFPVLITSMHRRTFDSEGKIQNSHGDYPEAMRQVAKEENVPLIDLNSMSKILYEALGPENSKKAFVHYPAGSFPGQDQELKDDSHHSSYGAYELAKCVVEGMKTSVPELAKYLADDINPFDPAYPDPFSEWSLPVSIDISSIRPEGN
jgi:lysophospholipase L1-like esterase